MRIVKTGLFAVGVAAAVLSMAAPAAAGFVVRVPEIDGSSVSAGIGLLAAGVLLLRARRGR